MCAFPFLKPLSRQQLKFWMIILSWWGLTTALWGWHSKTKSIRLFCHQVCTLSTLNPSLQYCHVWYSGCIYSIIVPISYIGNCIGACKHDMAWWHESLTCRLFTCESWVWILCPSCEIDRQHMFWTVCSVWGHRLQCDFPIESKTHVHMHISRLVLQDL